jgi:DDE_Tnp_1-associated
LACLREAEGARAERWKFLRSPQVPDPRKRRGRRHQLAGLLAVGVAAVLAGSRSFAAIGQWAADAGPAVRGAKGNDGKAPHLVAALAHGIGRPGRAAAPHRHEKGQEERRGCLRHHKRPQGRSRADPATLAWNPLGTPASALPHILPVDISVHSATHYHT